jgi:hypothetical protein
LFVVLIASNAELEALIDALNVAIDEDPVNAVKRDMNDYTNLRVDIRQARFGNATKHR